MEQRMLMAAETDSAEMMRCIDDCERCHRICLRTAMTHCLEQGGECVEPPLFRVMLACAELCRTTADAMLAGYALYEELCAVCARVCRDCAESCERTGELEECVDACRLCEASCARLTGGALLPPRPAADARRPYGNGDVDHTRAQP
jgi:hypothetical protein